MNYELLWVAIGDLRNAANQFESFIRANEGEPGSIAFPPAEQVSDRIEAYRLALAACEDARFVLHDVADREGHGVTKAHARKCNFIAKRCSRAIEALTKSGEL